MNKYGYDLDDQDTLDEIMYEWDLLEDETAEDQDRWHIVVKCPFGVIYRITWNGGSAEYQDWDPDYKMVKVKPVETVTTFYIEDED